MSDALVKGSAMVLPHGPQHQSMAQENPSLKTRETRRGEEERRHGVRMAPLELYREFTGRKTVGGRKEGRR